MTGPRHEMILASAGSGKTFALTDRFVQLLAIGARPEQIVALTFTRKAAGEFFDGILNKLASAASDPANARELAIRTGASRSEPAAFLRLLRDVIDAMPRLSLSTLDAFFARIVRSFPLELGLAGDFEILQEHAALLERRRVLQRIFKSTGNEPDESQRNFIEAFKRATFGLEEKRLAARLDSFLNDYHEVYLSAPDGALWGDPKRIWPDGCSWLGGGQGAPGGALRDWATTAPIAEKQQRRWLAFLDALELWAPGATPPREMTYVIEKTLAAWDSLARGNAVLEFDRKKQELSRSACSALRAIVLHVVGGEIQRRLETTRGIHAVLDGYERVYQDAVRRAGRLTFADVQRLLQGGPALCAAADAARTRNSDPLFEERRLLIDWRLDGQFDHWLLDEFQDTSAGQWSVLQNLVDEVVQDDSGRRTFFYVGDVKQAIYAWREGDSRLFREIFNHYNSALTGRIAERRLDSSRRSGPAILAMVNRVFGDSQALAALFPRQAVQRWSGEWRNHESAVASQTGQSAWIFAEDEEARFDAALRILRETNPLERGLTVAVLTQKNDTAARLADHLRRSGGLRAVAESDQHVCTDNTLTAALLALFQAAAHPGDTLAREHVLMTPLRALIEGRISRNSVDRPPITTPASRPAWSADALTRELLQSIHSNGFEATVEHWLQRLEPHLPADDVFSRERGRQVAEAARFFDESGSRDVAEFIRFMERHVVRESETSAVVRVMTIHKSKGLGFDVVILPDLEGDKLASRRDGLAVQKREDRSVEWVLDLPTKLFHTYDPVLSRHVESAEADACYDKLALLYVALTRAKRGLYVLTKNPAGSTSHNFPKLLASTLGENATEIAIGSERFQGPWSEGDPRWHEPIAAEPARVVPSPFADYDNRLTDQRTRRLAARTPSDERSGIVSGATLFSEGRDSAAFGTQVHALFAAIEWWESGGADAWVAAAHASGVPTDVVATARACLDAPEFAEVFRPPHQVASCEVWRERTFELVSGDSWVTGTFDRVVIERASNGSVARVRIFDFKTDRTGTTAAEWDATARRHARQMTLYRQAAAVLCGVSTAVVAAAIVLVNAVSAEGSRAAPIVLR